MKKQIFRAHLGLTAIVLATVFGCSPKNSLQDGYVYKNPESGQKVGLRAAVPQRPLNQAPPEKKTPDPIELHDATILLNRTTSEVEFEVTRDLYDKEGKLRTSERVLMRGKLDSEFSGEIFDTEEKTLGQPRLVGKANCVPDKYGQKCATLYVDVYYDRDGNFKQFHAIFPGKETPAPNGSRTSAPVSTARQPAPGTNGESPLSPVPVPGTSQPQRSPAPGAAPGSAMGSVPTPTTGTPAPAPTTGTPAPTAPRTAGSPAAPTSSDVVSAPATSSDEPVDWETPDEDLYETISVIKVEEGATRPAAPNQEPELAEGTSHTQDEGSGTFVSNPLPKDKIRRIAPNPYATPQSTTPPPTPAPGPNDGKPRTTGGLLLKLEGGGLAQGTHSSGIIKNTGTMLPVSSTGVERKSATNRAYGNGFAVDFVMESSRRFTMAYPECGTIEVNQISKPGGGFLRGHATHQHGSDFDIRYFLDRGPTWTKYVRSELHEVKNRRTGKTSKVWRTAIRPTFPFECFLKYTKFMYQQKFQNINSRYDGLEVADLFFVNVAVRDGVCKYVKDKSLKAEYGDALSLLYPEDGHDSHFHLRLNCSPRHAGCTTVPLDRTPPFRKRGCKNL